MTAAELRAHAPRLCRAYDQLLDRFAVKSHQHRVAGDELLSDERCLAHRQLQLTRAGARRGKGDYKLERHRKLREIEERVETSKLNVRRARRELDQAVLDLRRVDMPYRALERAA